MSFLDVWDRVKGLGVLPEAASVDFPSSLSEDAKKRLSAKTPKEVAAIVLDVISEVNGGSVETINDLVKKRI